MPTDAGPARWFAHSLSVPPVFREQQATVVRMRLLALAPTIAVLTLLWMPLDALGLQRGEIARILPLRLLLAGGLLVVAWRRRSLSAYQATTAFIWLQALCFGAMQLALGPGGGALRIGYGLFPFAIAAQLAVFPLPWLRSVAIGVAAFGLLAMPWLAHAQAPDPALWNDLWLLTLILALAAWGSHVQVRLLVDLLGARRDASRDPLTGLANRRMAEERLAADLAHALRHGEPLSVAMLDLDHFKRVNDSHGHATGDLVLAAVARVLHDELRGADLGVRYGGEEFLAILPGTDAGQALQVAERIRARVAQLAVEAPRGPVRVTASLGVATLWPGESREALLARADAALYRAKAEGRDRCVADAGTASAATQPAGA
ncbi:MAG: diguanylate cyclase [Lysobacteraceae bacterium]